jgi:AcrR family transcriptional regulator
LGSKERQERDRQRIRKAILDAARDLFISEGYGKVSMRRIAERIEYSPAAIYSYFPAKDDIFFALAEEGFRLLADHVLTSVKHLGDPLERVRRGLWAFYEFSKTYPEHFALMFLDRSVPNLSQDFQRFEFFQETTARAEADVRACMERGQFSQTIDPAAALHVLWVGMLGAATIGLAQRLAPGEDPDALAHDILESVLAGFTTNRFRTTFVASECALMTQEPAASATSDATADSHKEAQ